MQEFHTLQHSSTELCTKKWNRSKPFSSTVEVQDQNRPFIRTRCSPRRPWSRSGGRLPLFIGWNQDPFRIKPHTDRRTALQNIQKCCFLGHLKDLQYKMLSQKMQYQKSSSSSSSSFLKMHSDKLAFWKLSLAIALTKGQNVMTFHPNWAVSGSTGSPHVLLTRLSVSKHHKLTQRLNTASTEPYRSRERWDRWVEFRVK